MKADEFLDSPTMDEFLDSPLDGVTVINENALGRRGAKYLESKLPNFYKAILNKSFTGSQKEVREALIEAASKMEEGTILGADPQIAEVKAMQVFLEKVKPF